MTVSAFDRRCRDLARRLDRDEGEKRLDEMKRRANVRRWIDRQTGMWQLHAELDPERGAAVWATLDAASAQFASATTRPASRSNASPSTRSSTW